MTWLFVERQRRSGDGDMQACTEDHVRSFLSGEPNKSGIILLIKPRIQICRGTPGSR